MSFNAMPLWHALLQQPDLDDHARIERFNSVLTEVLGPNQDFIESTSAGSAWWNSLTPKQQAAYIEKHPNSSYAKLKRKGSSKKQATKTKVGRASTRKVRVAQAAGNPKDDRDLEEVSEEVETGLDELADEGQDVDAALEQEAEAVTQAATPTPSQRGVIRGLLGAGGAALKAGATAFQNKARENVDAMKRYGTPDETEEDREKVHSVLVGTGKVLLGALALGGLAFLMPSMLPAVVAGFMSDRSSQSAGEGDTTLVEDFARYLASVNPEDFKDAPAVEAEQPAAEEQTEDQAVVPEGKGEGEAA